MHSATALGEMAGVRLSLKAELFQKTGSFKVRGVFNRILSLSAEERARGFVSCSAGNHAAALAFAASAVGARATIVMPASAVPAKVEATRGYGGEVVQTDGSVLISLMAHTTEGSIQAEQLWPTGAAAVRMSLRYAFV